MVALWIGLGADRANPPTRQMNASRVVFKIEEMELRSGENLTVRSGYRFNQLNLHDDDDDDVQAGDHYFRLQDHYCGHFREKVIFQDDSITSRA
jgi:hypothetical protein